MKIRYLASVFVVVFFTLFVVAIGRFGLSIRETNIAESRLILFLIDSEIFEFVRFRGKLPVSLSELKTTTAKFDRHGLTDAWGEKIIFEIQNTPKGYVLFSSGPDKTPKTSDDIYLDSIGEWH